MYDPEKQEISNFFLPCLFWDLEGTFAFSFVENKWGGQLALFMFVLYLVHIIPPVT